MLVMQQQPGQDSKVIQYTCVLYVAIYVLHCIYKNIK